jgi:DNA-directed RNA polymerase subunit beta'
VKDKYLVTTVGKIIFNEIFPDDFPSTSTTNRLADHGLCRDAEADKKIILSWFVAKRHGFPGLHRLAPAQEADQEEAARHSIIDMVFHKYDMAKEDRDGHSPSKTSAILDKIKDQGFKYSSTTSAVTVAISDINAITNKAAIVEKGQKEVDKVEKIFHKGMLSEDRTAPDGHRYLDQMSPTRSRMRWLAS